MPNIRMNRDVILLRSNQAGYVTKPMTKECAVCGTQIEEGAISCPSCGLGVFRVRSEEQAEQEEQSQRRITKKKQRQEQRTKELLEPPAYSPQIDVSVCHAGRDGRTAARIAIGLRKRGINVWIDPIPLVDGITPAQSLIDAVAQSRLILYLCSRSTSRPIWLDIESPAFRRSLKSRADLPVLPVRLEPCDTPGFLHFHPFDFFDGDIENRLDDLATRVESILAKRRVFICHSSLDKAMVARVVHALKRHPGISLWYDEDTLKAGSILRREIESGISKADYLIAVLSKNAIDTLHGWIGFELDQAYERERSRNKDGHYFAIPVVLEKDLKIPGWLGTKVYVNASQNFDVAIERLLEAILVAPPMEPSNAG